MSLIFGDGRVISGPGNTPYVGANGHWWVGLVDLGIDAGSDIHYTTAEEFKTSMQEGIYFVTNDDNNDIQLFYINSAGGKYPIMDKNVMVPVTGPNGNWWIGDTDLGIPVSGDGSTIAGAAINDDSINATTTYSSFNIEKKLEVIKDQITSKCGKSVEFTWEGTRLGVRIEGDTEYRFVDLLGRQGMTGLDGDSIVDADMTADGDLIVTVQDITRQASNTSVITFEKDGVLTVGEMTELYASISRLNREVSNIKHSQYRKYSKISTNTDGEYENVIMLNGTGALQIILTKFTGCVSISVDGNTYVEYLDNLDEQKPYMLVSLKPDNSGLFIDDIFTDGFTRSLDVSFSKGFSLDVKVEDNDEKCYPNILVQGTHYSIVNDSDDDTLDDYIPSEVVGDDEIDELMKNMGLI